MSIPWQKIREWFKERWGEIIYHAITIPLLVWFFEWLAHQFVESGPVRDIGFYVIIVAVLVASVILILKFGRRQEAKPDILEKRSEGPDKSQFFQCVKVYRAVVNLASLQISDPFVTFSFWLFNGSLSEKIVLKNLRGHVRFNDQEQSQAVELLGNADSHFPNGSFSFAIRQWLSESGALSIARVLSGPPETHGRAEFRFDAVYLTICRVGDGQGTEHRLELPTLARTPGLAWEIRW
jgi:hypothetical protein